MTQTSPAELDQRTQPRRNLFVAAALHGPDGNPCVVRIRNLSPQGALIEGLGLPAVGARVRLFRGPFSAPAQLVWHAHDRAGLLFATPLNVADWLPSGACNRAQQRVDQFIFEWRAVASRGGPPPLVPPGRPNYAALATALADAAEELMTDPNFAENHPCAVQAIDMAADALRRLGEGQ